MSNVHFEEEAFKEYVYWQNESKKTLKKINQIIKDIERNGENNGIGKPEALKYEKQCWWSRHIDEKNRLVYKVENDVILITQCKGLYNDN